MKKAAVFLFSILLGFSSNVFAVGEAVLIKNRVPYKKPIRMRMPPQVLIDTIQRELQLVAPSWRTFWNNFVVEDDMESDEYIIIARAVDKKWTFTLKKETCVQPPNYANFERDIKENGGTDVNFNVLIGIQKKRSWFRYVVQVYEPMFPYKDDTCYLWSLPPGMAQDPFYSQNYRMDIYSKNMAENVYQLLDYMKKWTPPAKGMVVPKMKGAGEELISSEADELLSEKELDLPIEEQRTLIEKRLNNRNKSGGFKQFFKRKK